MGKDGDPLYHTGAIRSHPAAVPQDGVDILIVRENVEGFYIKQECLEEPGAARNWKLCDSLMMIFS